jgi:5-methylcytosine-specific restriction endonuclease McrA
MPANPVIQGADQNRTGVTHACPPRQRKYGTAWRKRSAEILDQRGSRCEVCGDSGADVGIRVHHLTYERFGAELDSDLLVVCRSCHSRIHAAERRAKRDRELDAIWAAL